MKIEYTKPEIFEELIEEKDIITASTSIGDNDTEIQW